MKILATIWKKFKSEPDIWFFYGFLLTSTLSIRKIIHFYPIKENFNEYSAISLYLSDIFLIFTLFSWAISILYNKYSNLSIVKPAIHSLYLKKKWITCWKQIKCSTWNILKNKLILIPLLLVIWAFLSILWSDNKIIVFYRSIKFLEFFLLYIYVIHVMFHPEKISIVPRGTIEIHGAGVEQFWAGRKILRNSLLIIIFLGLFQSIIAIWQFILQHSLGLFWLKESLITPEILGVAKVIIGSQKYIRAYGLFPHSNILGGFLLVSIILTALYKKLFHVEHFKSHHSEYNPEFKEISNRACLSINNVQNNIKCSTWNIFCYNISENVPRGTFLWTTISIQVLALILTFSKSAILGLIIAFVYVFINQTRNVPRGTLFHVEHFKQYFIISLLIFSFLLFYFKIDLYSLFIKSLNERLVYLIISIKAIASHIFLGLGNGQFVLEMQRYVSVSLAFWQFQPVHNVFLLILSELGIIGLFLFVWFLLELFANVPRGTFLVGWNVFGQVEQVKGNNKESILNNNNHILSSSTILTCFKAIFLGFIFIMIFDHYFWDIQQGQIMLWMIIGLIAGLNLAGKKAKR